MIGHLIAVSGLSALKYLITGQQKDVGSTKLIEQIH